MKSAFEHFMNLKHNSSAALIAKYVDRKLKGEKGTTEQEVEHSLDQVCLRHASVVCIGRGMVACTCDPFDCSRSFAASAISAYLPS